MLTFKIKSGYSESLKTCYKRLSHPSDLRFFCDLIGLSRAGNILNTSQSFLVTAFSEATHLTQFCVGFSKKRLQEMTHTIESTLQALYRYYSEMKSTWYKGKYTIDQEDIYAAAFYALQEALIKLPIQTPEDRKIKLAMLKNMVLFPCETDKGVDLSTAQNMERESIELIDQLAAEQGR